MATNNNGNLLDSKGEVAIDFVWGNLPMQPNDARDNDVQGDLSATGDNHVIAYAEWNGYPQYTPNDAGAGVGYIVVPSVKGVVTATATDTMDDAGLTVTVASGATNTATQPTRINVTTTSVATVYVSGGTSTWPVGTKVTIAAGTGIPSALVGDWTVTGGSGSTLVISGSGWTVADTGSITPGTRLTGTSGTIKTQSVAAGAATIAIGQAVTITPWA